VVIHYFRRQLIEEVVTIVELCLLTSKVED